MTTTSRVFRNKGPKKAHLVRGRGLNGEVWDIREDVLAGFSQLETESMLDISWAFDGGTPPTAGSHTGTYGFCHTNGAPPWVAGSVWYDDGEILNNVTVKGLVISPRNAIVGAVNLDANGIYIALASSTPYSWTAKGGSGGGSGDASSIQTIPVDPTAPTLDQVLVYDGAKYMPMQITQDMVGPAFVISSFGPGAAWVELGANVVSPTFNATYSLPPDATPNSVVLTDDVGTPAKDVTLSPLAFSSDGSFTSLVYGYSVQFTLTAKRGALTKTATSTIAWLQRVYWGVAAVPGAYDEAFIKSLASNSLSSSRNRSFTVTAGPGQKIFYCYRVPYGDATFTVGGFSGGFFKAAASVSVTNIHGVPENYMIWESDNSNLGLTTVVVT